MKGYKLEMLQAKFPNREDAFWYRGDDLAKVDFPNGKKLYAYATGEIRIQFEEDGTFYKGDQAVAKATELKLTDDDLNKIGADFDGWDMNNWFVVREYDINGELIGDDLDICHDYDSAMNLLEQTAEIKMKEYYE